MFNQIQHVDYCPIIPEETNCSRLSCCDDPDFANNVIYWINWDTGISECFSFDETSGMIPEIHEAQIYHSFYTYA